MFNSVWNLKQERQNTLHAADLDLIPATLYGPHNQQK